MTTYLFPPREEVRSALEQLAQYGVAAPEAAHLLDVGSNKFLQYFEAEVLDQFVCRGGATCKVIEGTHGSGKTHLLLLLHGIALRKGMAVVRTDLSQALSLEDWRLIAKHILENIEVQTSTGVIKALPEVLGALGREGRLAPSKLNAGSLPHGGFARAIALLSEPGRLSGKARSLVSRFAMGERVTVAQLKSSGVTGVKHPLSTRNAELVVKTVFAALFRLGVPGALLLFDENEETFAFRGSRPPRRVQRGANLLRRLIDGAASGSLVATVVVFAVLPDFIRHCSLAYPALGQRLQVNRDRRPVGWRSPVIPLEAVSTVADADAFLDEMVDRIGAFLEHYCVRRNGHIEELREKGRDVLAVNAGAGYRRDLVKLLATLAARHF